MYRRDHPKSDQVNVQGAQPQFPDAAQAGIPHYPGYPGASPYYPGMELARAYVPIQRFGPVYPPDKAMEVGTLFPELYRPYPG